MSLIRKAKRISYSKLKRCFHPGSKKYLSSSKKFFNRGFKKFLLYGSKKFHNQRYVKYKKLLNLETFIYSHIFFNYYYHKNTFKNKKAQENQK